MDISFEIYNEDAVKRLQEEDPDILPEYSIDEEKDLVYNKKQVNAAITSAILQGKSIPNIASDLSSRMKTTNQQTAVKAARTAVTSAQNGGRLESFYKAKEMGIDVKKKWMATLDSRTRPRHRDLDGEIREVEEAFSNGLMYPGDSSGAAGEVWWCRCRLGKYLPDVDMSDAVRWSRDPETGERQYVPSITYSEWLQSKTEKRQWDVSRRLATGSSSDKNHWYDPDGELDDVSYLEVKKLPSSLTTDEIIKRVGGGDETGGSCSSLALAYIGNRNGYDVLDFRGGESEEWFSAPRNLLKIAQLDGVEFIVESEFSAFKAAEKVLKALQSGKEYYFTTGAHSAVVRKTKKGYEYLELQQSASSGFNGYYKLTTQALRDRFGCTKSFFVYGIKIPQKCIAIDAESLGKSDEFREVLGYINTNASEQKKSDK